MKNHGVTPPPPSNYSQENKSNMIYRKLKRFFCFSIGLFLVSCSSSYNSVDKKNIQEWMQKFKVASFWKNIDWSKADFPVLGSVNDQKTKAESKRVANKINELFRMTESDSKAPDNLGSYYDTGFMFHVVEWDDKEEDIVVNPFPTSLFSASSFLRGDLLKGKSKPLFFMPQYKRISRPKLGGVVYKPLSDFKSQNKPYFYMCGYPQDSSSNFRYLGCGRYVLPKKAKDKKVVTDRYKLLKIESFFAQKHLKRLTDSQENEKIDALWKAKKSIDTCGLNGIRSTSEYKEYQSLLGRFVCGRDGSREAFKETMELFKKYKKISYNEVELRFLGDDESNEAINKAYRDSLLALTYVFTSGKDKANHLFLFPSGKYKKYNLQLGFMQKQQKLAKEKYGIFLPILRFNIDEVKKGLKGNPLEFSLEDQVVSAN